MPRRIVHTPCCGHDQATAKKAGQILVCTKCKRRFYERADGKIITE